MKRIATFIIIFFCCPILLSGCVQRLEDYDFKSREQKYNWGRVKAKLRGTKSQPFFTVIRGSPYELLLSFMSHEGIDGKVLISEIRLQEENSKKIIFENKNISHRVFKKEKIDNRYYAYFLFENLELQYVDMMLWIRFYLIKDSNPTEYETKIQFNKNYNVKWSIISH